MESHKNNNKECEYLVSITVLVMCSVVLFIVGVVAGFAVGCLTRHCIARSKQSTPAPPPAELTVYEEVALPAIQGGNVKNQVNLNDNVAYGQVHFSTSLYD